jgi:hypothetical protein
MYKPILDNIAAKVRQINDELIIANWLKQISDEKEKSILNQCIID